MLENLLLYIGYELIVWLVILTITFFVIIKIWRLRLHRKLPKYSIFIILFCTLFLGISFFLFNPGGNVLTMPSYMHSHAPGNLAPSIPILNAFEFFLKASKFERIADIGADPNEVPKLVTSGEVVKIDIVAQEVIAEVSQGSYFNYWTYNKQVPGPMYRVKVGDMVEVSLTNHKSSLHNHNIDLHSVTGPGGGAGCGSQKPTGGGKWAGHCGHRGGESVGQWSSRRYPTGRAGETTPGWPDQRGKPHLLYGHRDAQARNGKNHRRSN